MYFHHCVPSIQSSRLELPMVIDIAEVPLHYACCENSWGVLILLWSSLSFFVFSFFFWGLCILDQVLYNNVIHKIWPAAPHNPPRCKLGNQWTTQPLNQPCRELRQGVYISHLPKGCSFRTGMVANWWFAWRILVFITNVYIYICFLLECFIGKWMYILCKYIYILFFFHLY